MNPTYVLLLACIAVASPNQAQTNALPNGAYYSAQRPWIPPLPFHPFPEFPAVEVESKRYVYDDTLVNYDLLRAESLTSGPPVPGGGGGAGSGTNAPPYIAPTVPVPGVPLLKIELLTPSPGMDEGVKLISFNTKPEFYYRVEATTNLSNHLWTVIDEFVATGTNSQFTAHKEDGTQFYRVHQASDLFTFPDWFERIEQYMEFKVKTSVTSGTISWELFADEVSVGNNTLPIVSGQALTVYDPAYDPDAWPDTGLYDVAQWRLRVGVTPTPPPGTAASQTTFVDVRKKGKQRNPRGTYHGALAQVYGIFSPFVQDEVDVDQFSCASAMFQVCEMVNMDRNFWQPNDVTQIIADCGLLANAPARWTNLFNMLTAQTTWLDYFHFMGHGDPDTIAGGGGAITKKMIQNSSLKTNGMTYVALDACSTAEGKDFLKAFVGYDKLLPREHFRIRGLDPAFACGWDKTKPVEFVNQTTRVDEHFWFWLDWYYDLTRRDAGGLMYKTYKQALDFATKPDGLSPFHTRRDNPQSKGFVMVGCEGCRFDERPGLR